MPRERWNDYMQRDPVKQGRKRLLEEGGASDQEVQAIEQAIEQEMNEAIQFAKESPEPSVAAFLAAIEAGI